MDFKWHFLVVTSGKPSDKVETHLVAKYGKRPRTRAVGFFVSVLKDVPHEFEILAHGDQYGKGLPRGRRRNGLYLPHLLTLFLNFRESLNACNADTECVPLTESTTAKATHILVVLPKLDKPPDKVQDKSDFFGRDVLEALLLRRKMQSGEMTNTPVAGQSRKWRLMCLGHDRLWQIRIRAANIHAQSRAVVAGGNPCGNTSYSLWR